MNINLTSQTDIGYVKGISQLEVRRTSALVAAYCVGANCVFRAWLIDAFVDIHAGAPGEIVSGRANTLDN